MRDIEEFSMTKIENYGIFTVKYFILICRGQRPAQKVNRKLKMSPSSMGSWSLCKEGSCFTHITYLAAKPQPDTLY
jgi:hypothetical protein